MILVQKVEIIQDNKRPFMKLVMHSRAVEVLFLFVSGQQIVGCCELTGSKKWFQQCSIRAGRLMQALEVRGKQ